MQAESEKLKKLTEEAQKNLASTQEQPAVTTSAEEKINQTVSTEPKPQEKTENIIPQTTTNVNETTLNNNEVEKTEESVDAAPKNKISNIFGKFKSLKIKKPLIGSFVLLPNKKLIISIKIIENNLLILDNP